MVVSKRVTVSKTEKYHKNIDKRGKVPKSSARSKNPFTVGPIMLAFFLFVVVGSALLQIIRTATVSASTTPLLSRMTMKNVEHPKDVA